LKVDGMTDVGRTTPPLPKPRRCRCEIQVAATTRCPSTREAVFSNTAEFTITVVHAVVSASPRARGELHGLRHAMRDETGWSSTHQSRTCYTLSPHFVANNSLFRTTVDLSDVAQIHGTPKRFGSKTTLMARKCPLQINVRQTRVFVTQLGVTDICKTEIDRDKTHALPLPI
jgi:hypothetical protein